MPPVQPAIIYIITGNEHSVTRLVPPASVPIPHLPVDPTFKFKQELKKKLIEKGFDMGILNKEESEHLVPLAPRLPTIYSLPKIHKTLVNPPGIPIISGIDSVTLRVGKYIDHYL